MPFVFTLKCTDISVIQTEYDEFSPVLFTGNGEEIDGSYIYCMMSSFDENSLYFYCVLSSTNHIKPYYTRKNIVSAQEDLLPSEDGKIEKVYMIDTNEHVNLELYCVMFSDDAFIVSKAICWTSSIFRKNFYVINHNGKEILVVLCISSDNEEIKSRFMSSFSIIRGVPIENLHI